MIPLMDNLRCKLFPLATLLIIALNCVAFVIEMVAMSSGSGDQFFAAYTFIPAKVMFAIHSGDPHLLLAAAISIVTAMFLHGGIMHIVGNMLFLFVFGRAMEARLGHAKFTAFYMISGLAATFLQCFSDPSSTVPNLGASGAIAGVLGGYLLLWPKSTISGLLVPPFMPIKARAYWFLLFWFGMQVFSIIQASGNTSGGGVAYFAHVGGFLAGLVMAFIVKRVQPVTDVCYIPSDCEPCKEDHTDSNDQQ
jgi:membrane associated rhomboid family serine protease